MPEGISLRKLLHRASLASWSELMRERGRLLLRVEYNRGGTAPLEFVKVWASAERAYWSLVCEYWPAALWSRPAGSTFANDYSSACLTRVFAAMAEHPERFPNRSSGGS